MMIFIIMKASTRIDHFKIVYHHVLFKLENSIVNHNDAVRKNDCTVFIWSSIWFVSLPFFLLFSITEDVSGRSLENTQTSVIK